MGAITTTAACLAAFALLGCGARTHNLVTEESSGAITVGTFRHEGLEDSAMVLKFEGQSFKASGFVIKRKQDLADLKRQFGPSKHYDQIFSGLDTDHFVYSAEPLLRAGNGVTLRCFAIWRAGGSPAGNCVTVEGTHIYFRFE